MKLKVGQGLLPWRNNGFPKKWRQSPYLLPKNADELLLETLDGNECNFYHDRWHFCLHSDIVTHGFFGFFLPE